MDNILVYSEELANIEYSPTHPFKPVRARQMYDLLHRYSLLDEVNQGVIKPEFLPEDLLYLFHTKEYIDALKTCDTGEFDLGLLEFGLGTHDNPIFKDLYSFSLHASGGTYLASQKLVLEDARFAFNPIGGFHHAMSDHAEGFCYINDIAVTLYDLANKGYKIAYIDIDVHHGDGVQNAFYNDDRVFTFSIHETGHSLFPGTGYENEIGKGVGEGFNVNIPLLKDTDDEVYVYAFEEIIPPLLKQFDADLVCIQVGGDGHRDDPLAHLNLTSNGYAKVLHIINENAKKILATGGGGYNLFKTSALWALAWSIFCGVEPRDDFAGAVGGMMYGPESESGSLYDEPYAIGGYEKDNCFQHAKDVVNYIKKIVYPLHGIGG